MKTNFFTKLFRKSKEESIDTSNNNAKQTDFSSKSDAKTLLDSGIAKAKSKNSHGALKDFTKSIKIDPTNAATYLERCKVRRELKDEKGAKQDFKNAEILIEKSTAGIKAYDDAGAYYDAEDYKNAIRNYNKAISLLPSLTDVYYYRGISKQLLEDFKGALEDFTKGIEHNAPNNAEAYYQRSKIKSHELNDKDGALQDLNKAIELKSNDSDFYYSRAILLDDYDGLQDLNKAIEITPTDSKNYFSRSLKRNGMKDYEGSIQDMTKFIELGTDETCTISDAYSLRAGMRILLRDMNGALQDHNKAVEADPTNTSAIFARGTDKCLLGDYKGAIIDFNKVIELNPSDADAYYHRGTAKQSAGMEDEGAMDIKKAKTLGYKE